MTSTTVYLSEDQLEELRRLRARERVPMAALIREAVAALISSRTVGETTLEAAQ